MGGPPPGKSVAHPGAASGSFKTVADGVAILASQRRPGDRESGGIARHARGYCFAFNSSSGCHDRNCPHIHAQNPSHARRGASETPATGARGVGHGNGGGRGGEARAAGEGGARPKAAGFFTHGKDK